MDGLLNKLYYKAESPASYTSLAKLYKSLERSGQKISRKDISKWLANQDVHSLHIPSRFNFKRGKIFTKGRRDMVEADLMDVAGVSKENDGVTFILVLIDDFSKEAWLYPLKSKSADNVLAGFKYLFKEIGKIKRLRSDAGTEFTNKKLTKYLEDNNIEHYITRNESKASMVERVIRTFRKKINKFLDKMETNRFIDNLQDFAKSYNQTYHRSIKMRPIDVNDKNELKIWKRMYLPVLTKVIKKPKLKRGDQVRISISRGAFPRGYHEQWSREHFIIDRVIRGSPNRYKLKDLLNEKIEGSFYLPELQKVNKGRDVEYRIEKILKRRRRGGKDQLLVKWLGWGDRFNSWINKDDVKSLDQ